MRPNILVVDDDLSVREFFEILLAKEGYDVTMAESGEEALEILAQDLVDLVVTDLKMKKGDGMMLLKSLQERDPDLPVIMMTAHGAADSAVEAMKIGAYDYLQKPFNLDELKVIVSRALERSLLRRENRQLKSELTNKYQFSNLLGESEAMNRVYDLIKKTALTKTNVLIVGESGTGKELVARAIHFNSDRKDKPFVTVNCGAIPENLIESELFGHVKGAFTGAVQSKRGLFEVAHQGTIFLDEIGELPLIMQVKLLRVLQERNFMPVGSTETMEVDVRVIAATNRSLEDEVKQNRFREDLFYRLNVIQIALPALRNRKEDIRLLSKFFLQKYSKECGKDIMGIDEQAMQALINYDYLGNVRELENIIERSVALENSTTIQWSSLPPNVQQPEKRDVEMASSIKFSQPGEKMELDRVMESFEKDIIVRALDKTHGSQAKAARLLGITPRSMRYRVKKHGLQEDSKDDLSLAWSWEDQKK